MNWEKSKSLFPLQRDFLLEFFAQRQDFFLTGGSALGIFYLDHRFSYDLDLFSTRAIDWLEINELVESIPSKIGASVRILRSAPFFRRYEATRGDEKQLLDFVFDQVPAIEKEKNRFGAIIVDTPLEIGVNKICALLGRVEIKDLVDLFFLAKERGFHVLEHIEEAKRKDAGLELPILSYLLSQVEVTEIPDYMLKRVSVEELKQFVSRLRGKMAEISFPENEPGETDVP